MDYTEPYLYFSDKQEKAEVFYKFIEAVESGNISFHGFAVVKIVHAPKRMECTREFIDKNRFIYIVSGEITYHTAEGDIHATEGDIVYIRKFTEYKSEWTKGGDSNLYYSVLFDCEDLEGLMPIFLAAHDNGQGILSVYKELLKTYLEAKFGYKIELSEQFYRLLNLMNLATHKESIRLSYDGILPGILTLQNRYAENIDFNEVAKECGMSERNFRRIFKEYAGTPPVTYVNHLRINKAKNLLLSGYYSVKEVANAVNIPDVYYFSKLFKRETGLCPTVFVKSVASRKQNNY